ADLSDPLATVAIALGNFFENGWIISVVVVVALPLVLFGSVDWRTLVPALLVSFPIAFGTAAGGRTVAFHYYAIVVVCWALALRFDRPLSPRSARLVLAVTGLWAMLGPLGV